MGIFGFKTKYDIVPKVEKLSGVVTNYSDVDVIKMNAKVVVPDGYTLIIGKKGKATDFFETGEYFLNSSILPYMCRKFGIDKIKNGKSQDKISADFYFVKKDVCGGSFKTYKKVTMSTKAYGAFSVRVYGMFSYRVKDVREFMQSLLNEFDYIRTGEAEDMISSWVSEVVVSELEKKNFILSDIISNSFIVVDALKNRVIKLFSVAGLELLDFKITKYDLPKEYQERSDKNIKLQEQGLDINNDLIAEQNEKNTELLSNDYDMPSIDDDINDAKKLLDEFNIGTNNNDEILYKQEIEQELDFSNQDIFKELEATKNDDNKDILLETKNDNNQNLSSDEYVPFGDFVISSADNNLAEIAKESKQRRTFVDLSLDDIYQTNQEVKRCLNCGAENDKNATHCILCGENFVED